MVRSLAVLRVFLSSLQFKLEALGERRPPSGAVACAKTRFNLAFRLYRPERHQNLRLQQI